MKLFRNLSPTRIIAFSFAVVILIGTVLLSLPIATSKAHETSVLDALFTAVSATCVIGLSPYDTYTHWTMFGQIVILVLFQIGGLGIMSFMSMFAIFLHKKIGLQERILLVQTSGNIRLNGVIKLLKKIFIGTFLFEAIGAVILAYAFYEEMGLKKSIYFGIFHSVSAFCNAGFDLMGFRDPFSSMTYYEKSPLVCFTLMALIVLGGLGFFVWSDVLKNKIHFSRYSLHSKIILYSALVLILVGWFFYYIFELNGNLYNLTYPEKIMSSLFMSISTRTAGFVTMDISQLSESGLLLTMCLMFIGAGVGSTSGGVKTTTVAILLAAIVAFAKGKKDVVIFKRRIENDTIRHAASIFLVYLAAILVSTMIICFVDRIQLQDGLFETIAAVSTVGYSRIGVQNMSTITRIIMMILMYGGRIGFMSLLMVFWEKDKGEAPIEHPTEEIMIG